MTQTPGPSDPLEHTLQKRIIGLETAAEISAAAAAILECETLLQTVVEMACTNFNLYNVYIYLNNDADDTLKLVAAAGHVGQKMMAQGRTISVVHGQSFVAHAARNQESTVIPNVRTDPGWLPDPLLSDVRSEIVVPMIENGKLWGVLDLQSDKQNHFAEEDVRIFAGMASQVAIALSNARRFQKERELSGRIETQAQHLTMLNELGQALTARQSISGVIDEIYRGASGLIDTSNFYITLFNRDTNEITFALIAVDGVVEKPNSVRTADQGGLTEYLIKTKESLLIKERMTSKLAELGIKRILLVPDRVAVSWLGVPIISGSRVMGTLTALSFAKTGAFDVYDQELLMAIAGQAATAIESAYLFEEAKHRVRHERIMREVTAQIRSAGDVDGVMRTAVQEIGRILGRRTFVYLDKEQLKTLSGTETAKGLHHEH